MQFLNPFVLIGLVAATIPILLHFFNLQKLQTVDFSTLTFLKELQKTKTRKLKVSQLLLLLLRVGIIVFAVLAFARPTIPTSLPGLGTRAKSSVVILMDNSFSMEVADERGVRLKQAKDAALAALKSLQEGDEVALIQMGNPEHNRFVEFTRNIHLLQEEIQKLPVSYTTAKLESSLRMASSLMARSINLNKEVFIITDAQTNIIQDAQPDSLKLFDASTAVFVLPIGIGSKAGEQNLSVDSLHIQTKIFEQGKPVEIEARVRNSGNEKAEGVIVSVLIEGERVAQRAIDIPPGETRTIPVSVETPSREQTRGGLVHGMVEVEGDILDADNRRHFSFVLPEKPRIAIVAHQDEGSFLQLALQAGDSATHSVRLFSPETFSSVNTQDFDALFFVNIPRFNSGDISRLQQFLAGGGGVMVFAGNNIEIQQYNTTLFSAFPLGQIQARTYKNEQPAEFSAIDKSHPVFTGVFKPSAAQSYTSSQATGIESPKLLRALPLLKESLRSQPLIEVPEGVFLAEAKISKRKFFYCAVPPTPDFGNFPVTGIFVTLMHRITSYITATENNNQKANVGENITLKIPAKYASGLVTIIDPNNTESVRVPLVLPSGVTVTLDTLWRPGVYAIQSANGTVLQTLSVNPPASESNMTLLAPDELRQKIATRLVAFNNIYMISDYREFNADTVRSGVGTELWKLCVVLAIICALAEMLLALRISRSMVVQH